MARYEEEDLDDEIYEGHRNPGLMARAATIIVVILLAIAAYCYLDSDKGVKDPSQLPLITENHPPEKTKPIDPGGMDIPHQDASVYDHLSKDAVAPEAEKLMPTTEAPVTIAGATAPPSTPANIPDALPSLPAAPPPVIPAAAPAITTPATPAPTPSADKTPAPEMPTPAPVTTTASAESTATELAKIVQQAAANQLPPTDANARIQLGAVSNSTAAQAEWLRIKTQYSDALTGLDVHYSDVNLGDKGEFVRIQTDPISQSDAEARCQKLKLANQACMVVKAAQN